MSKQQFFEAPDLKVTYFDVKDVITTSEGGGGGIELPDHEW